MNSFKKILLKNIHKESPEKLADDIGDLYGKVSITGRNRDGKVIFEHEQKNSVTNLSKSILIRLLAGKNVSSNYYSNQNNSLLNPDDFAITKMRFSNLPLSAADDTAHPFHSLNRKYLYYNFLEPSSLYASGTNVGGTSGTGVPSQAAAFITVVSSVILQPNAATTFMLNNSSSILNSANYSNFWNPTKLPPSLGTLSLAINNAGNTVYWQDKEAYNRNPNGNGYSAGSLSGVNSIANYPKLLYSETKKEWDLVFKSTTAETYNITGAWEIGKFNIINTLVPTKGANTGQASIDRFGGQPDFYRVSNPSLRFASNSPVDDISVVFNTNMTGGGEDTQGVGDGSISGVDYGFLFLFTENDTLFSTIRLDQIFSKTEDSSFSINWTLSAPT